MQTPKKTTLANGLRIITVPQPANFATTVLVMVQTGSKYETKNISGVAHFLEHMCFKGTKKRPSARIIASELDGLGASSNAFTGQEYTGYYAKVENHKALKALDLIADIYLNPLFNTQEMETEKGVVIEELHMYEDIPQRKIYDLFMRLLYGDQPAGWNIGGNEKILRTLKRKDLIDFRKKHYLSKSTILVLAGGFNEKEILAQAKKLFTRMPNGKKSQKLAVKEKQTKPQLLIKQKKSDQTHIRLGVRTFSMFDSRRYGLELLSDILGGGMSSRLFHEIREKLGAAYYVRSEADLYTDHGYLAASAGVQHAQLERVLKTILKEFKRLKTELISSEELARAKSHLSGNLLLGLETSDALGVFYGTQEILTKKITTPNKLLKKINAVTPSQIRALAKQIFLAKNLNLAMIGPELDPKKIELLLNSF